MIRRAVALANATAPHFYPQLFSTQCHLVKLQG